MKRLLFITFCTITLISGVIGFSHIQAQAAVVDDSAPGPIHDPQALPDSAGLYVELVQHSGGDVAGVVVQGRYAYLAVGPQIFVLDIANPDVPSLAGQTKIIEEEGVLQELDIAGNYLYAVQPGVSYKGQYYAGAVRIFDISNPVKPVEITYYQRFTNPHDLEVSGNTLVVADDESGLVTVDVSDPFHPVFLDSYPLQNTYAYGISVAGQYAYAAYDGYYGGLWIIDIGSPGSLHAVGSISAAVEAVDVFVDGGKGYFLHTGGYTIIDISNPAQPVILGESPWQNGQFSDVVVQGNLAFTTHDSFGLQTWDVSNPGQPVLITTLPLDDGACDLALADDRAYLAQTNHGMGVVDVSNSANLQLSGDYHRSDGIAIDTIAGDYGYGMGADDYNNYAIMVSGYGRGLFVYDLKHPHTPVQLGWLDIIGSIVDVEGDILFVIEPDDYSIFPAYRGKLLLVDISNKTSPHLLGTYTPNNPIRALDAVGNTVYWIDGDLNILDITDPAQPTAAGALPGDDWARSVVVSGTYAYVGSETGIHVVDVSNPAQPDEMYAYCWWNCWVYDIVLAGNQAFVCSDEGPQALDISDPLNIHWLSGTYDRPECWNDLRVQGDFLYLPAGAAGVRIYDISYPTAMGFGGYYFTADRLSTLAVKGDTLYGQDARGGSYLLWFGPNTRVEIPTGGGVMTSTFDQTVYSFPAGTFTTTNQVVAHRPRYSWNLPLQGMATIGHAFEVSATNQAGAVQPLLPYEVTVRYTDDELGGISEESLGLYHWDGAGWQLEPGSSVDATANTVTAQPDHFGLWAVLGEGLSLFLPSVWR